MARPIPCDNGDGQPGAYVITNLDDGSTFAVCVGCWISLCATVAQSAGAIPADDGPPATAPQPLDPTDPGDPDADIQQADQADAHEERVRSELAARPDSAATSETVTWTPDSLGAESL